MNKEALLREAKVLLFSLIFGATIFPYIFGFFYLLAVNRLSDFPGLFTHWYGFFLDLFRGDIYIWGVVLLPYGLVQLIRAVSAILKNRNP